MHKTGLASVSYLMSHQLLVLSWYATIFSYFFFVLLFFSSIWLSFPTLSKTNISDIKLNQETIHYKQQQMPSAVFISFDKQRQTERGGDARVHIIILRHIHGMNTQSLYLIKISHELFIKQNALFEYWLIYTPCADATATMATTETLKKQYSDSIYQQ